MDLKALRLGIQGDDWNGLFAKTHGEGLVDIRKRAESLIETQKCESFRNIRLHSCQQHFTTRIFEALMAVEEKAPPPAADEESVGKVDNDLVLGAIGKKALEFFFQRRQRAGM